jgi:hypothetical protein
MRNVVFLLVACGGSEPPARDAGDRVDSGQARRDAGPLSGSDAGDTDAGTECGAAECFCRVRPRDGATTCWHSLGGLYGEGACSAGFQCCGGSFRMRAEGCGECACTEETGHGGCVPEAQGERACVPAFDGTASPIPADVRAMMTGVSWREGCPVALDDLALLEMPYVGYDGAIHRGQMVVAAAFADDVLSVFRHLYEVGFPIERMELVDVYGGDDDRSMEANNTSAFNCRRVTGGTSFSQHSYGTAIDLNPLPNPYVRGDTVLPPAGRAYLDRTDVRQGMIVDPGPVVGAFAVIGWEWGGNFTALKDYQHFSENGR